MYFIIYCSTQKTKSRARDIVRLVEIYVLCKAVEIIHQGVKLI